MMFTELITGINLNNTIIAIVQSIERDHFFYSVKSNHSKMCPFYQNIAYTCQINVFTSNKNIGSYILSPNSTA